MKPNVRWTTAKDYDKLLDFYVTELMKAPDFIAHPELRAGIQSEPEKWVKVLRAEAGKFFTETFNPKNNIRVAVIETVQAVNGAKKSTAKKAPAKAPTEPVLVAMLRVTTQGKAATVLDVLVAEAFRDKGLGTKLVQFTQKTLESEGILEANLSAPVKNADAARFFVTNGFMPISVTYSKSLTPPPPRVHRVATTYGFGAANEE